MNFSCLISCTYPNYCVKFDIPSKIPDTLGMQHSTDILKITPPVYYNRHIWSVLGADSSSFGVDSSSFQVDDSSYRVDGSSFRVDDSSYRVDSSSFCVGGGSYRVDGSSFCVDGSSYRVDSSSFRVDGSSYRFDTCSCSADSSSRPLKWPFTPLRFSCYIYDWFTCAVYAPLLHIAGALHRAVLRLYPASLNLLYI